MSKQLLTEYFELCPNGYCDDVLTESDKRFIKEGGLILSGVMQRSDIRNGNGRVYPHSILEREMKNYKKLVEDRRALGELNHPDKSEIDLRNVCHLVTEVWWNGKDVMGKIQVLNTPSGQVLKELINANVKIGISSRGTGSVRESKGDTIVEDDFQLICFDMVSEPSTHGAFMSPRNESVQKTNRIDAIIKEMLNRK